MHLALSGLDRLKRPISDARRLFFADRLLNGSFPAGTIVNALDLASPESGVHKYSPDQPRVPAGSGRASGQWTNEPGPPSRQADFGNPSERESGSRVSNKRKFRVELPSAIVCAPGPLPTTPFTQAAKALADTVEMADSISKWRELGPKGEAEIRAAVIARGWQLLGEQVYVRTSLGLRVEDVMVRIPAGTAGNGVAYDGFIEVKVNGGRYNSLQQAKDTVIGATGGILLTPVRGGYRVGSKIILETGLANVTITYEPK